MISWSAPTTRTGDVMDVDHYVINCRSRLNDTSTITPFSTKTLETSMEVFNVNQNTDVFFTIAAVTQGIVGPEAMIGIFSGKYFVLIF